MKKLADLLKEERTKKKVTLDEAALATRIRKEFLMAIEEGKLHNLPSKSYALGFIKVYGEYLGISAQKSTGMFRREYAEDTYSVVPEFRRKQHLFSKKVFFRPRFLIVFFIGLVLGLYFFFQYSSLLFNPSLTIVSPKEQAVIDKTVINVVGKTDQYATVKVNDEDVFVNLNGEFKKSIFAFTGEQKITVIVKNRFGKETKRVVTVIVK